jgi:hypothetical protein
VQTESDQAHTPTLLLSYVAVHLELPLRETTVSLCFMCHFTWVVSTYHGHLDETVLDFQKTLLKEVEHQPLASVVIFCP